MTALDVQVLPVGQHWHALLEIAEALHWGASALGYDSRLVTSPAIDCDRKTILVGPQLAVTAGVDVPRGTILYQVEAHGTGWFSPGVRALLAEHETWTHTPETATWMRAAGIRCDAVLPIAWAPVLEKIPRSPAHAFDAIFYGSRLPRRSDCIERMRARGLTVFWPERLYGRDRDIAIGLSRAALNVHYYPDNFETVRCLYLLGNGIPVLSETSEGEDARQMAEAIRFAPIEEMPDALASFLSDPAALWHADRTGRAIAETRRADLLLRPLLGLATKAA